MKSYIPIAGVEEMSHDKPFVSEKPKFRKLAQSMQLASLANDTKWSELFNHMQNLEGEYRIPLHRCQGIDPNEIWGLNWDFDWYHVPYPAICINWFEVRYLEEVRQGQLLKPKYIDHSDWIKELLTSIGFEFEKGSEAFRIYGYSPKDRTDFKQ